MFNTKIIGAEFGTYCDCCGRALKVGIRLGGLGTFGADCVSKSVPFDRKRYSKGRPDAAFMRTLAKIMEKDGEATIDRFGYSNAVKLTINPELLGVAA